MCAFLHFNKRKIENIIRFSYVLIRIASHRVILFTATTYFQTLFEIPPTGERKTRRTKFSDEILKKLMTYCYKQVLNMDVEDVDGYSAAVYLLENRRMRKHCIQFYKHIMRPANCLSIWMFAEQYSYFLEDLKTSALAFSCRNFEEVVKCEEFMYLGSGHLRYILKSNELNVNDEKEIFNTLAKWIRFDLDNRKPTLNMLLANTRFAHLKNTLDQILFASDVKPINSEMLVDGDVNGNSKRQLPKGLPAPPKLYANCIPKGDTSRNQIWEYELDSGLWSKVATLPGDTRKAYASAAVNGQVVMIGGRFSSNNDAVAIVEGVDVCTGEVKDLSPLTTPRKDTSALTFNDEIFVFGGRGLLGLLSTVEK